jgi:hypothetical protein
MATSRPASGGLSTSDLQRIGDTLAGGRRPTVVFTESAGQIAGQTGQVVRLTDPDASEEWLVVRFGHDELPFSPADLAVPPRARANGRAPAAPARSAPPAREPGAPPSRKEKPLPTGTAAPLPPAGAGSPPAPGGKPSKRAPAATPPAKPARPARPRAASTLTVTLACHDGEWTLTAQQGSKVLAKPYLLRPAEALKLVAMVDVPLVQEAVAQLVDAERAGAERRAEQLRSELAQVEARLAELRDSG